MKLLQQLLTEEHANSRFVYMLTNVTVCVCVVALVAASILKGKGNSPSQNIVLDAFIFLVGTLLSGGVAGAAGRFLTNRKPTNGAAPTVESSEKTTVTEKVIVKA